MRTTRFIFLIMILLNPLLFSAAESKAVSLDPSIPHSSACCCSMHPKECCCRSQNARVRSSCSNRIHSCPCAAPIQRSIAAPETFRNQLAQFQEVSLSTSNMLKTVTHPAAFCFCGSSVPFSTRFPYPTPSRAPPFQA